MFQAYIILYIIHENIKLNFVLKKQVAINNLQLYGNVFYSILSQVRKYVFKRDKIKMSKIFCLSLNHSFVEHKNVNEFYT